MDLIIALPADIFFTLSFIFNIRSTLKNKFLNTFSMLYLIQKSRALSKSKLNFIIDQGIQQFLLDCYFKNEISLKKAQLISLKLSKKKWSADKYLFLSCSLEEMKLRISLSKKHIKQLNNENLFKYCERYLKAFKKFNLEKRLN